MLCFAIPCLEFLISSYFPISPLPTPFEDTAKQSLCLQGGATPRMINGLARADGGEACFIHEGFNLHASEILAPVTSSPGILMPTTGLLSQLQLTQLHLNRPHREKRVLLQNTRTSNTRTKRKGRNGSAALNKGLTTHTLGQRWTN